MTTTNLTADEIKRIDRANMLGRVLDMPQHFRDAAARAQAVTVKLQTERIRNIIITGMGGSAIGGELAKSLTYNQLPVPLTVCRSYTLPHFAGPHTLVIVSSYSGNTEETLSTFQQAQQRGAQIVCVTSGGEIGERAAQNDLTKFTLPPGFPPRSALVHLLVPILTTLHACGYIADPAADIKETTALLEKLGQRYHPAHSAPENLARALALALALAARLPLIYAAEIYETVAWRWKEQFCENAEILSWHNVFPELNHNELVGWGQRREMDQKFQVIYINDTNATPSEIHPRVQARMNFTQSLIEQSGAPIISVAATGESLLARFFSLIFLGDLASVYLAVLGGVDPTPVAKIDYLKTAMAKISVAS